MHKSGVAANKGGTYYLKAEDKVPFDDSKFQPGDEVAAIVVAPFSGDRGEFAVNIKWADGKWTTVLSRKLVTGSKYDVQFDNLDGTYEFGNETKLDFPPLRQRLAMNRIGSGRISCCTIRRAHRNLCSGQLNQLQGSSFTGRGTN